MPQIFWDSVMSDVMLMLILPQAGPCRASRESRSHPVNQPSLAKQYHSYHDAPVLNSAQVTRSDPIRLHICSSKFHSSSLLSIARVWIAVTFRYGAPNQPTSWRTITFSSYVFAVFINALTPTRPYGEKIDLKCPFVLGIKI
ncbi:hypothetical protein B0H17DRAFT_410172 [Mycena rosella]|uniref:Uncharacterized protein n=1 Tax=Mycena rosella TaxID=1033263 RepID=A0AAD7CLK1_MYCRO|nr:hypothetical protein B0H17DRAFT_410172 [Mycena rosella]